MKRLTIRVAMVVGTSRARGAFAGRQSMNVEKRRRSIRILAMTLLCLSALGAVFMLVASRFNGPALPGSPNPVTVAPSFEFEELVWRRLSQVELDPADEASVQAAIAMDIFDYIGLDSDSASDSDEDSGAGAQLSEANREARKREQIEIAFVPSEPRPPLMLVRGPTLGNCADGHMIIFGPRDPVGQRVMEERLCTYEVLSRRMPSQPAPDLVFPGAGFAFDIYRWVDDRLVFVETLIDDVNRTGHSPCSGAPIATGEKVSGNFDCYVSVTRGSYDLKSIIQEPAIRARLRAGFGDRYPTFLINLTVRAPWQLIDNCLAIHGNAPHRGDTDQAILALCRGQHHIYAALLTDGEFILLAPKMKVARLPTPIRDFLGDALDESAVLRKSLTWVE